SVPPRKARTVLRPPWKWPICCRRSSPTWTIWPTLILRTTILTTREGPEAAVAPAERRRKRPRSARRRARELALQGVYAWLLRGTSEAGDAGEIDAHLRDSDGFSQADTVWYDTLLHGVIRQAPGLRD